jgi:hypothetical protein
MKLQKTKENANTSQVFSLSSKNPFIFVGTTMELKRDEYHAVIKVESLLSSVVFLLKASSIYPLVEKKSPGI